MTKVSGHIVINAPKEKVWEVISDLGAISVWHPGVANSYYTSKQREGVGAARRNLFDGLLTVTCFSHYYNFFGLL